MHVYFCCVWFCYSILSPEICGEERLQNCLFCVGWNVKLKSFLSWLLFFYNHRHSCLLLFSRWWLLSLLLVFIMILLWVLSEWVVWCIIGMLILQFGTTRTSSCLRFSACNDQLVYNQIMWTWLTIGWWGWWMIISWLMISWRGWWMIIITYWLCLSCVCDKIYVSFFVHCTLRICRSGYSRSFFACMALYVTMVFAIAIVSSCPRSPVLCEKCWMITGLFPQPRSHTIQLSHTKHLVSCVFT